MGANRIQHENYEFASHHWLLSALVRLLSRFLQHENESIVQRNVLLLLAHALKKGGRGICKAWSTKSCDWYFLPLHISIVIHSHFLIKAKRNDCRKISQFQKSPSFRWSISAFAMLLWNEKKKNFLSPDRNWDFALWNQFHVEAYR